MKKGRHQMLPPFFGVKEPHGGFIPINSVVYFATNIAKILFIPATW